MVGNRATKRAVFWVFVLPALGLYLFFAILPLGQGFWLSTTNWDGTAPWTPAQMPIAEFESSILGKIPKESDRAFLLKYYLKDEDQGTYRKQEVYGLARYRLTRMISRTGYVNPNFANVGLKNYSDIFGGKIDKRFFPERYRESRFQLGDPLESLALIPKEEFERNLMPHAADPSEAAALRELYAPGPGGYALKAEAFPKSELDLQTELSTLPGLFQGLGNGVVHPVEVDYFPLVTPVPRPLPTPSSGGSVVINPLSGPALPYDSQFTGNTIPTTVQACHSYDVTISVKNTGTLNWTSANDVFLLPSSADGIMFDPARVHLPDGVVIQPGQTWTLPVKITIPCSLKNGTCTLRFKLDYTVQTKNGPVTVPFGDTLTVNIGVSATTDTTKGLKMGEKIPGQYSSIPGIQPYSSQYAKKEHIKPVSIPAPIYTVTANTSFLTHVPLTSMLAWIGLSG